MYICEFGEYRCYIYNDLGQNGQTEFASNDFLLAIAVGLPGTDIYGSHSDSVGRTGIVDLDLFACYAPLDSRYIEQVT